MTDVHRIIDANWNRAREALRVLEDIARFSTRNDASCESLKAIRHDLRSAMERLGMDRGRLLAQRDVESDPGTRISTPSEGQRLGLRDVAIAAGARLSESLRTLEECAKGLGAGADAARTLESIRYRAYVAEQAVVLEMGAGRSVQWKLCVLVSESLCAGRPWDQVARAAIQGGADCVQLREKDLPDAELIRRSRRLVEIARSQGDVSVVINDRPDVAVLAEADGVHLGQGDMSVRDARRIGGMDLLVGVSTSSLEEAIAACEAGADSLGVGPMFPSTTKAKPSIAGPAYLRALVADARAGARPHLAIGGITPENVVELIPAGCRGVAVSSCVCGASDPAGVCARLRAALEGGPPSRGP